MNISIIGSGNVATVLGRYLQLNGYIIEEVVSRNKVHALSLAKELNAIVVDEIKAISKKSDAYIIAVNDDAIETIANQLMVDEKIVLHTCGSASINILNKASKNFGVLYPLQSLRKEIPYLPVIPFLVDGNNGHTKSILLKFAKSISNNVIEANDEQRMQYHLSAVITSNFTNYLYSLTSEYCKANNINFSLLNTLIQEVVNRLQMFNPSAMQTGPAVRGDVLTIQKHLDLLKDFPQLQHIYEIISESIAATSPKSSPKERI